MKQLTFLFAALLLLPAAPALAQQLDQVFGSRGTPTRGTVSGMSAAEVELDVNGSKRKFPVNEIKRITFAQDPRELERARDAAQAGRYEEALVELGKIDMSTVERGVVKQDIEFYKAYCEANVALAGGGDKLRAAGMLKSFVDNNSQSMHYYQANRTLGDLAMATEQYPAAEGFYAALLAAPWMEYKMSAAVLEARAKLAQNKVADALQRYEQVLGAQVDSPESNRQKLLATIGKAVCLAKTEKADEGIQMVNEVIAKNDSSDSELFARAYNALGACYEAQGDTKQALEAYLHTDILFFSESDAHAESLYNLSKLWNEVQKSDRAVRARSLLNSRYGGTRWAKKD